jgi:hypothetical protein
MSPRGAHVMRVVAAGIAHGYFADQQGEGDEDSSHEPRRAYFTSPGASVMLGF